MKGKYKLFCKKKKTEDKTDRIPPENPDWLIKFSNEKFLTGLNMLPSRIAELMSSANPDSILTSNFFTRNRCIDKPRSYKETCPDGWHFEPPSSCFKDNGFSFFNETKCRGNTLFFRKDIDVEAAFLSYLKKNPALTKDKTGFFLYGNIYHEEYYFSGMDKMGDFSSMVPGELKPEICTVIGISMGSDKIRYNGVDCPTAAKEKFKAICHKPLLDCTIYQNGKNAELDKLNLRPMDFLLDPSIFPKTQKEINRDRISVKEHFKKINMTSRYSDLFELLWHSTIPCFDVKGVTSIRDMQYGLLKACYWNGHEFPCSELFTTSPTDRGMCCTFNLEKAQAMFKTGQFSETVERLQARDKSKGFGIKSDGQENAWENPFKDGGRPTPRNGKARGLTVLLDAHSNKIGKGSIDTNINGFIAIVDASDQYPITSRKTLLIRPGHQNMVSLKATKITAGKGLKDIAIEKRNCLFEEEMTMDLHKVYSQSNCFLECAIRHSILKENDRCMPWYFPVINTTFPMCDPWSSYEFVKHMKNITESECSHCHPDCESTHYDSTISAAPFLNCDYYNLGVSDLCKVDLKRHLDPPLWGEDTISQYPPHQKPSYVTFQSNMRHQVYHSFKRTGKIVSYNAYEKDIALVNFFFESPTAFQFIRQPKMTTIQFISQLGGLLGLCMGFSVISFFEILYWFTIRLAKRA